MSSTTAITAPSWPAAGPSSQTASTVTSGTASTPPTRNACITSAGTGAAPTATTVAGYLLSRLAEAGVISVFGVPGDYNLGLLDAIAARPGMEWVGMATEQGAGYAADSYARLRGLGAVVTTFGVGELSALNAIAGAYAESAPVVHIVGTPAVSARGTGPLLTTRDDDADPATLRAFGEHARRVLATAGSASVLLGHLARRHHVTSQVAGLAAAADLPVAVLSAAKGDFPEHDPRFAGLYAGAASAKKTRLAVEDTNVLITVGVTLADTLTGGGTHHLPQARRIDLAPGQARIGDTAYPGVGMRQALAVLTAAVRASHIPARADLAAATETPAAAAESADPAAPLTQQHLWQAMQEFLLPGDLVIADQGTAFYGAAGLTLPDGAALIGQPLWASIGWALPAALGASLAAPGRRVILITGDGALQQTAPELGTLLAQGLAPVVIVLGNGGYTIERVIHNPSAAYHHIPRWDWRTLPALMAKDTAMTAVRAVTAADLDAALAAASDQTGLPVLVEAVLGWDDAPPLLQDLARVLATRNHYASR